jgi:tripartite-type tricarboxylate transporter receptor subunit TctC
MIDRRRLLGTAGAALPILAAPALVRAQGSGAGTWPDRPVRWIVPFPAGGGTDTWARMIQEPVQQLLGQPLIIENRAGGGGIVGAQAALQAPADGYTWFYTIEAYVTVPITQRINPFDALRDFAPIGRLGHTSLSFTVGPAVPASVTSFNQYLDWARRQPSQPIGNWSAGGSGHAMSVVMERETKLPDVKHVAYRGEAPMMQDNLAGVFHGGFHAMVVVGETVRAGRLRPLVTAGVDRVPSLANRVPTFAELGGYSDRFNFRGFTGLTGNARIPAPIQAQMADIFRRATQTPEIHAKLRAMDTVPSYEDPATFAQSIRRVQEQWAKLTEELALYQSAS